MMVGARPDIERLIEEGLMLYGRGDLDGALLAWERVLALDPENAQAISYVDYVRMNYEILTTDVARDDGAPFGIADDEPEYQIEILPGEDLSASGSAPLYIDPLDAGWALADEAAGADDSEPLLLVLEVDDPADVSAPGIARAVEPEPEAPPISFDDATREYPGGPPAKKPPEVGARLEPVSQRVATVRDPQPAAGEHEFLGELTPGFGFGEPSDYHTPPGGFVQNTPGFETLTDVRELNTGFVQPTRPVERKRPAPPELQMTLRTPGAPPASVPAELDLELAPPDRARDATPAPPPADSPVAVSYGEGDAEPERDGEPEIDQETITQLASRTSTEDQPTIAQPRSQTLDPPPTGPRTRDLPPTVRPPAARVPTDRLPSPSSPDATTGKLPAFPTALTSAPTRDLGLRPPGKPSNPEDDPTKQSDVRRFRAAVGGASSATISDAVLGFDPIDARSAEILEGIDAGASADESSDERTRRRITTLFDRAVEWGRAGDHERAVIAVDLAMSEDPNSALTQKLIHRHRDAVVTVFQGFLGNLDRQPTLARPLHELANAPISPRAAFLLSRIDGTLSLDEILDVSGMPRMEAFRYLCQLLLRGILR